MIWDMSLMDKCPICNMNISVYDKFCINCGTKLSIKNVTNNKKRFQLPQWRFERSNKERFYILIVSMMIAFIISFVISLIPVNITIVGAWADDKGETVSFNKESYFEMNIHYGKYTIRDKKLLIDFEDSDYLGFHYSYEWSDKAKFDSHYWYISENTLYFQGKEYKKLVDGVSLKK